MLIGDNIVTKGYPDNLVSVFVPYDISSLKADRFRTGWSVFTVFSKYLIVIMYASF